MRGLIALAIGLGLGLAGCAFDSSGVDDGVPDADPEVDTDGDGVRDADDNCPDADNAEQRDEDGDTVGNACDNCPHVTNPDQDDSGEDEAGEARDGVGDACDPEPAVSGNALVYFEGFDDPEAIADWGSSAGTWSIFDGALRQTDPNVATTIQLVDQQFGASAIDTRITLDDVPAAAGPTDTSRAFGTVLAYATQGGSGTGYLCIGYYNPSAAGNSGSLHIIRLNGASPILYEGSEALTANLVENATYDVRQSSDASSGAQSCRVASTALPSTGIVTGTSQAYAEGELALQLQYVAAHVDYVVVFSLVD